MAQQQRDWSSLPKDLLRLVLDLLPWSSHPSFGAACRHWRSVQVQTPFFPAWVTPLLLSAADVGSTNLRFYSPYYHKNFEISSTLEAPGAKICCAVGRHLTLLRWKRVLEADLATGHVQELPPVDYTKFDFVVYDGSRRMFGVYTLGPPRAAIAIRDDDGSWQDWDYPAPLPEDAAMIQASSNCNPVLHGGSLYVLYADGKLAVYDERRTHDEDDGYLEILDKPECFGGGLQCEFSYLFESDEGELMAILVGRRGTPVHVVKLNEQEMEREKVESLQGRALFTGTLTTMMRKTNVKWMRDKIFLPRMMHGWPDTVRVDIVDRDGELAFVPTSTHQADATVVVAAANQGAGIWSYEMGSKEEPREFWDTEKVDYSIWVDFNRHI
ncbi:unnamed protein product [Urochloa humidicola]